jgi:hypothetical protein
LPHD